MSASTTRKKPARSPVWSTWKTPQILWGRLYLLWALDGLLLLTAILGAQVHRDAMKSIGKDTAPSMIHAQHIKSALADMDASAANELLAEPGAMPEAVQTYEKRRQEAAEALIEAAKNITFGDAEQIPIQNIQIGLGTYEVKIQRARDLHERKGGDYVGAYRQAADIMDKTLLPQADQLDQANHDELVKAYAKVNNQSVGSVVFLLLAGALMIWALISLQKFLNQRMHRILNPMLILATLGTVSFLLYTFITLGSERHLLSVARGDAFTSLHALWRARAVAYSANAEESRYLLDPSRAKQYQSDFLAKSAALATAPGMSFNDLTAAARRQNKVPGFTGYLADAMNNTKSERERDSALMALERFGQYLRVDGQIRELEESGRHDEALELCTGAKNGGANWTFDQFDQALDQTLGINQQVFDNAVRDGFRGLSYFELKACVVAFFIALLAFAGMLPRIREYS